MESLAVLLLGLGVGAAYAIEAQGIVLVYRASRIVNFAQAGLALVGAYGTYSLHKAGMPVIPALICAVILAGLVGVLIHYLVLRPLAYATDLVRLVAILGVLMVLESAAQLIYGAGGRTPPTILTTATWHLSAKAAIGADRILLAIIGAVLALLLALAARVTRFGLLTRAVAEDPLAFGGLGRSPDVISAANWFLGGVLGGLAGALLAPIVGLSVDQMGSLLLPALAAALVARFQSFLITFITAMAIGAASAEVVNHWPNSGLSGSVPLLAIVVVLIARGQGPLQRGETNGRMPEVGTGRLRIWGLLLFVPVIWAALKVEPAWANAIATTCATALILLSVVIITGYAGQVSLAQVAVAGVAALIAGKLSGEAGLPFLLTVVLTVIIVLPAGVLMGIPAFRSRGTNAAIATLAIAFIVNDAILSNPSLTGGELGTRVKSPQIFGFDIDPLFHPNRYAITTVIALIVGIIVISWLRRGRIGRRWLAVRVNERSAASLGVNVFTAKMGALVAAAGFAALGGALMAFRGLTVDLTEYDTQTSISVVVLTVIGGVGFIAGALNGAIVATGGILAFIFAQYTSWSYAIVTLVAGVIVILNAIAAPSGIFADITNRLRGLSRKRPSVPMTVRESASALPASGAGSLVATSLTVEFGGIVALNKFSLHVKSGEIVGLIGPNGAGKSTCIDALSGFTKRKHPGITLDGHDLSGLSPTRRARLGMARTFQSLELFEDMTLRDNLRVAVEGSSRGFHLGRSREAVPRSCAHAINAFGLEPYLDTIPKDMPLALRQLSGIARAMAFAPKYLLLDEPAAGLDAPERRVLSDVIRELAHLHAVGVLLVEHDVELVMSTCDRVVALDFGNKIVEGTPAAVRESKRLLEAYLGSDASSSPIVGTTEGVSA